MNDPIVYLSRDRVYVQWGNSGVVSVLSSDGSVSTQYRDPTATDFCTKLTGIDDLDIARNRSYDIGHSDGYDAGYDDGHTDGHNEGYGEGYEDREQVSEGKEIA